MESSLQMSKGVILKTVNGQNVVIENVFLGGSFLGSILGTDGRSQLSIMFNSSGKNLHGISGFEFDIKIDSKKRISANQLEQENGSHQFIVAM